MKRLIFYTLILFASIATATAQTFPIVQRTPCENCVNLNYEIITGSPATSNGDGLGGNIAKPWRDSNNNILKLPYTPTYNKTPINEDWRKTFLTLGNSTTVLDKVKVLVKRFVPGVKYTMHYSVLSSKLAQSNYGSSATLTVSANPANPAVIGSKTTNFTPGVNTNKWVEETITFTAIGTELLFNFSGKSKDNIIGYVNFDISNKPFDCILSPEQVELSTTILSTPFQCGTVDLFSTISSETPANALPVWKLGSQSSLQSLGQNQAAHATIPKNAAKYYAFYYTTDMENCYNVSSSTASVTVQYVETQVSLKRSNAANICPSNTVDLEFLVNKQVLAAGIGTRWFTNANHLGEPVDPKSIASSGTYYAFLYDELNNCYSTDLSTAKVIVTISSCNPCAQTNDAVILSKDNTTNICPIQTVDLNSFVINGTPQGANLVWFDNDTHSGNKVPDPSKITISGTYYAYFYDASNDCYSSVYGGDSDITVTINNCPPTKVSLSLKVFLQGATTVKNGVATMRNDLQAYPTGPTTSGLLPTQDPYGGGAVYPQINSAGEIYIVDWVKVEIRGMTDPSQVLESQSLLLLTDGSVVNIDGSLPKFNSQFGGARIAVKHRNHLPVLGLGIVSFNAGGTVNYDFTGDLSKAYNVGAPPQMVLTNGVWCMPTGDVQQDYAVDNVDYAIFDNSFNNGDFDVYSNQDLNLDGLVDNVDFAFFDFAFNAGFFSTLINY